MTVELDYCNKDVAQKVAYEFHMFTFLGDTIEQLCYAKGILPGRPMLAGTGNSAGDDEHAWACLEAFLVHTRTLYEFFTATKRDSDNVLPKDFVSWSPVNRDSLAYMNRERYKRLHKAMAHIAQERVVYEEDKLWDVMQIRQEIGELIASFRKLLATDRQEWFDWTTHSEL